MKRAMILLLCFGMVFLTFSHVYAGTIYVDAANTSGVEDGSLQNPFNTIQVGLDAAVESDTVSVAPGIYYGAIELKHNVKLISQKGPQSTVIDGMGTYIVVWTPYAPIPVSHIEGFTIRNGTYIFFLYNRYSFGAWSSLTIKNCVLRDSSWGGVAITVGADVLIERTAMTNMSGFFAIGAILCPTPIIRHVTVDNVSHTALLLRYGVVNLTNSSFTNIHNFVGGWGGSGIFGTNNNVWNYTNWLGDWFESYPPAINLQNTISEDPLFVNPPEDYGLRAGSPLIDAGAFIEGLSYRSAAPDIGAYEYGQPSIPELVEGLAESYSYIPAGAFKNAGEQRRFALHNKIMALLNMLDTNRETLDPQQTKSMLESALDKLIKDIWAKGDGFYGGNPKNDWITMKEEQDVLYPIVMDIKRRIEEELNAL